MALNLTKYRLLPITGDGRVGTQPRMFELATSDSLDVAKAAGYIDNLVDKEIPFLGRQIVPGDFIFLRYNQDSSDPNNPANWIFTVVDYDSGADTYTLTVFDLPTPEADTPFDAFVGPAEKYKTGQEAADAGKKFWCIRGQVSEAANLPCTLTNDTIVFIAPPTDGLNTFWNIASTKLTMGDGCNYLKIYSTSREKGEFSCLVNEAPGNPGYAIVGLSPEKTLEFQDIQVENRDIVDQKYINDGGIVRLKNVDVKVPNIDQCGFLFATGLDHFLDNVVYTGGGAACNRILETDSMCATNLFFNLSCKEGVSGTDSIANFTGSKVRIDGFRIQMKDTSFHRVNYAGRISSLQVEDNGADMEFICASDFSSVINAEGQLLSFSTNSKDSGAISNVMRINGITIDANSTQWQISQIYNATTDFEINGNQNTLIDVNTTAALSVGGDYNILINMKCGAPGGGTETITITGNNNIIGDCYTETVISNSGSGNTTRDNKTW